MRKAGVLCAALLGAALMAPLIALPAAAQLSEIFPWLTPQQDKPAPRRSYVKLPTPAPLPPARPARSGDQAAYEIPQVPAAAVAVPEEIAKEIESDANEEPAAAPETPAAEDKAEVAEARPAPADEPPVQEAANEPAEEDAEESQDTALNAPGEADEAETPASDAMTMAKVESVPLPPERPDKEADDDDGPDIADKGEIDPGFPEIPAEAACRLRLKVRGVQFTEVEKVVSTKVCGIPAAIRVTALSPSDKLSAPATLNCRTAEALTDWYFQVVAPAARRHFDATPVGLRVAASYDCRNRNGGPAGPISEHAFGNAIDISAILFRDRKTIEVSRPRRGWKDGFFLREINAGACAMFTTVIGPEGDAAHHDHFHLDMKKRKRNFELCQ